MKYLIAVIFVLLVDFTVWTLCQAAKNGDKTIENPERIKIRGKKY